MFFGGYAAKKHKQHAHDHFRFDRRANELCRQPIGGELVDRFFIIKRGHVALFHEDQTGRKLIDQLGPGEMFGLLAEIEGKPQPLTVITLDEVECYRVDYDQMIDAVGGPDQPLGVMVRFLAGELREAYRRLGER